MKTRSMFFLLLCSLTALVPASAQPSGAPMPPPVLNIFREEIKAGRNAGHETLEEGYVQAFAQAHQSSYWLGMTSASGPNEAWYLTGYNSFAALEKDQQDVAKLPALQRRANQLDQLDAEFRTGQRGMMTAFRKDLSYHPERVMPSLPKARYFSVLTVRMRPGHDVEFLQAVRMYLEALEKANVDDGSATYQVLSGAPSGTYLVLMPVKSLAMMDAGPMQSQAINTALGPENGPRLLKLIADSFLFTETTHFALSPKMSYVSKEFAAGDPEFWLPKTKAAAKAPAVTKKQIAKNQ